jgi:proline iminopeptidase
VLTACGSPDTTPSAGSVTPETAGEDPVKAAKRNAPGVQTITLENGYQVWTQRVGDGDIKLLTLHGGPGASHECFEIFEKHLPQEGIQVIYYDQLGSYMSDLPDDKSLWVRDRFVEELEEVRQALELEDFYLLGNSWGGMLTIEYALKYPQHLKGIVISNMTASIPSYVEYIGELRQQIPEDAQAILEKYEEAGDYHHPEYEKTLMEHLYTKHICRLDPWPDAVVRTFDHMSTDVYYTMNGDNEFYINGNIRDWDRWADLEKIEIPSLLLVGEFDTMSPRQVEEMGERMPTARAVVCPGGSHLAMWDSEEVYHRELIRFIEEVEAETFEGGR